jgi:nicotinate-nucleotide adenylyltransferase
VIALFGGAFDPPHNGHVALARAALDRFRPARLVVLVSVDPGHRTTHAPPAVRLQLAQAAFGAFPNTDVELDPHPRTVDLLRGGRFDDPLVLLGADQFAAFPAWKEPDEVLRLARLGVATRSGIDRAQVEALARTLPSDRVELFEMPPVEASSTGVRARARARESIEELVPPDVARLVGQLDLYAAA